MVSVRRRFQYLISLEEKYYRLEWGHAKMESNENSEKQDFTGGEQTYSNIRGEMRKNSSAAKYTVSNNRYLPRNTPARIGYDSPSNAEKATNVSAHTTNVCQGSIPIHVDGLAGVITL